MLPENSLSWRVPVTAEYQSRVWLEHIRLWCVCDLSLTDTDLDPEIRRRSFIVWRLWCWSAVLELYVESVKFSCLFLFFLIDRCQSSLLRWCNEHFTLEYLLCSCRFLIQRYPINRVVQWVRLHSQLRNVSYLCQARFQKRFDSSWQVRFLWSWSGCWLISSITHNWDGPKGRFSDVLKMLRTISTHRF